MNRLAARLARDPLALLGLVLLALLVVAALSAPLLATHPAEFHLEQRLMSPSLGAPFGTDRMGSDIFTSILFGARVTLLIASVTVAMGVLIGVPIGLVAGYYRNWISDALMRIADIALAVPQIVLAIAITQTLGPSIQSVVLALSLTYWPFWTRLVYAETRSIRNEIFIESAVALGASPWRVMVLHILPAIASSIVVRTSIGVGATILAAATLGFLGLGAPPPMPEWGRMIAESREYLPDAWWYPLAPGVAIFLTVLGFYLFGDGLRDVLDPSTRQSL
jgi:peptide/nickel transport system permease protein